MTTYASADIMRRALLGLHERTLAADEPVAPGSATTIGDLFGGALLIRELSARQRLACEQAAQQDSPDDPDDALYQALIFQLGVVDPASGAAGPDGRIDPRTRRPLFAPDEVAALAEARAVPLQLIAGHIAALSGMRPADLQRGRRGDVPAERDAGAGPGAAGAAAGGVSDA